MIDTHTHLYTEEFDDDRDDAVKRAIDAGITRMMLPNIDRDSIARMRAMHEAYPELTVMAMGLHPTEVKEDAEEALAVIADEFRRNRDDYKAIGEIGVDLYWDRTFERAQMEVFDRQCALAAAEGLPVIIHCREALDQVLEVVSGHPGLRGVMHSFGGTPEEVDRVRRVADFYFGINGIATFKNSRLDPTICEITPERLLLETDSPYLAPVPHRGKRNETSFIVATAARCAQALGMTPAAIDEATTANARSLFRL